VFQQQLQKNQQQQLMNCIDPYCGCNQSVNSMSSQSANLATISNFIGQHQEQHRSLMSKQSMAKTIKQRRNEDRTSERRPGTSLVQSKTKTSQGSHNKKNISKLLQTGNDTELAIQIIPEPAKDYPNTKRGIKNA